VSIIIGKQFIAVRMFIIYILNPEATISIEKEKLISCMHTKAQCQLKLNCTKHSGVLNVK